ncbi:PAS domain-containing hybrid sensor histidine kinase/response regulator [Alkaliflexus imshenetskii]|uniref:PAS domain-containing hybrid sensor histidine kinase/response regulator n=1 Tax=Alkaliflexus imshenetskii TaxID=286730 RepID=UPI0004BB4A0F|nr:PAS domain-containing hybrid sensor histidine kinase/response regulator [Alkaliflexus imshenetskii]
MNNKITYKDKFSGKTDLNIPFLLNNTNKLKSNTLVNESEIRYRRLFESAKDGILILDFKTGKIVDANPFIMNLIDCSLQSIIGCQLWEIGLFRNKQQSQKAFNKLKATGYIRFEDMPILRKNGTITEVEFISNVYTEYNNKVIQCNIRDITQRRQIEKAQQLTLDILSRISVRTDWRVLALEILKQIKTFTGMEAVGIRLNGTEKQFENLSIGLPKYFSMAKKHLKSTDIKTSHKGIKPLLECVCNNVLFGYTNPALPYFTEKGSFFSSNVTEMLPSKSHEELTAGHNPACNLSCYESVAFIPLRFEQQTIGILQLIDKRPHALNLDIIDLLESVGNLIGIAYTRLKYEKKITESEKKISVQLDAFTKLNSEYQVLNSNLTEKIEQIQHINSELVMAKQKAEESDNLKSAFLSNMSHEIRTPLNAIIGFSNLLAYTDTENTKLAEFVQIINSSGDHLLTIINDILDMSRIESNQLIIKSEPVSLNKILFELLKTYEQSAANKKITIKSDIDDSYERLCIISDENRIKQVLCNLLNNSIKFTKEGGVEFGYNLIPGFVEFFVKDTGIGIDKKNHDMVFHRFRQIESKGSIVYGGNGLGLSISRALVEKLGGTISLHSEVGKGTEFRFTIPYNEVLDSSKRNKPVTTHTKNLTCRTILLVEDDLYSHAYLDRLLTSKNYNLLHAWDGKEAVKLVMRNLEISLVLMDIKMPKMDGFQALKLIKNFRPELPVIAQTAYALSNDKEKAINEGFDNYLSKPISETELFNMLSGTLKYAK